jgi:1-phosphofructokinase
VQRRGQNVGNSPSVDVERASVSPVTASDPIRPQLERAAVAVFAPSPVLTVTVESSPTARSEVHLHAGGQGFWVARMAASLGARVLLCVPLGGESGTVLRTLLEVEGVSVLAVRTVGANAAYLHDRRSGERRTIVETPSPPLRRHELDELYGVAATAGLETGTMLLTGPRTEGVLPPETYTRLASDLRANGHRVLADLTGEPLRAALDGGLDVLKLSSEELIGEGLVDEASTEQTVPVMRELRDQGANSVLISRGPEPALALLGGRLLEVAGPRFVPVDPSGAGDSMFAALGVGLAAGLAMEEALRLGAAAGALTVTRHGLGSGHPTEIDRLRNQVRIREVDQAAELGQETSTASIDAATSARRSEAMPDAAARVKPERAE